MKLEGIQFLTLCLAVCVAVAHARTAKKVIRGQNAYDTQFPYQVSLQTGNYHFCGGSIISSNHILTAAHCVVSKENVVKSASEIRVVTGVTDHQARTGDNVFAVAEVIAHPNYNGFAAYHYDIAVLRLETAIPFNEYQLPIDLTSDYTSGGEPVILSGWGVAHYIGEKFSKTVRNLQTVQMTVIDLAQCAAVHGEKITDGNICALAAPGSGACNGDSGGPLVHGSALVGVVSWGNPCALGTPDVFSSVAYYFPWIRSVTQYPEPW